MDSIVPPVGAKKRTKTYLKPGHGLFQWMKIANNSKDLSGVSGAPLKSVSVAEVRKHVQPHDCWIILKGVVYNVSRYIDYHPGGEDELLRGAGCRDCTNLFNEIHSWVNIEGFLRPCRVGLVENGKPFNKHISRLGGSLGTTGRLAPPVNNQKLFQEAVLLETRPYNYNSIIMTFKLGHSLHLEVGQHIKINTSIKGKLVSRPYTPISVDTQNEPIVPSEQRRDTFTESANSKEGIPETNISDGFKTPSLPTSRKDGDSKEDNSHIHTFTLLVKVYSDGKVTPWLGSLKAGDRIKFSKVKNYFYISPEHKQIGMIAGGTGIAPMLQVLHHFFSPSLNHSTLDVTALSSVPETRKNVSISLLFANVVKEDILLKELLDEFEKRNPNHFKVTYTLTNGDDNWKGERGRPNEEKIAKYLPPPSPDTLMLICGPVRMTNAMASLLSKMDYTEDMVHEFI